MGVHWFRLGSEKLIACGGLSVGLLKNPVKQLNADQGKILAVDFSQPALEMAA